MSIFLNAGVLSSPTCTLGDYKIEWRKNSTSGEVAFISGQGNDPTLQSQHPLVNEVVQAGNLYPTIIYVYINGSKVTSTREIGEIFSPDLVGCLDFVTIDTVGCDTLYNNDTIYNFVLSYNNVSDVLQNKSRTFSYDIGATTQYVAWKFDVAQIADGIKFYYCTSSDPEGILIDYYITGFYSSNNVSLISDLSPLNYPTNPKVVSTTYDTQYTPLRHLVDLSPFTYATGDYLKIEIIGSILDPTNNNTNWSISLGCLETFDSSFQTVAISQIDLGVTPTIIFNDVTCQYEVTYKTVESAQDAGVSTSNNILKYLSVSSPHTSTSAGGRGGQYTMGGDTAISEIRYTLTNYYSPWLSVGICENLPQGEEIIIENTNGNLLITYPNINEYNKAVGNISEFQADQIYIDAVASSPTDLEYYRGYTITYSEATSCGDTVIYNYINVHFTSIITYNSGALTINFTMPIITNQYPGVESCFTANTSVSNYVQLLEYFSLMISTYNTGITYSERPIRGTRIVVFESFNNVSTQTRFYTLPALLYDNILPPATLTALGFCLENDFWKKYKQQDKITFTSPSTPESRLANWTLERQIRLRTGICTDTDYELVYQQGT